MLSRLGEKMEQEAECRARTGLLSMAEDAHGRTSYQSSGHQDS